MMQGTTSSVNATMAQPLQNTASQGICQLDPVSDTMEIMDIAVGSLPKPHFGHLSHNFYAELTVGEQTRMTSKVERSSDGAKGSPSSPFLHLWWRIGYVTRDT